MTSTVTDVEKALADARELEEYWRKEGWQSLQSEEETMSAEIIDIHSKVQLSTSNTDPEVRVYIELETNIYEVPIEDVSGIHPNDGLTIGKEDLYEDWINRILLKLGGNIIHHVQVIDSKSKVWSRYTYLSPDDKVRIIWEIV